MNLKKILSFAAIALLIMLYVATFISAIFTSPVTPELFKICVLSTFVIPVFLYAYLLIYKLMKDKAEATRQELDEAIKSDASSSAEDDTDDDSAEDVTDNDPALYDESNNTDSDNTTAKDL